MAGSAPLGDGRPEQQRPPARGHAPPPAEKSEACSVPAAASVLDYRPSTVAVAAVLAASHGALSKEALESKMTSLSPSFLLDKEDVYACHSLMLSASEISPAAISLAATSKSAKRPRQPPSCPGSICAGSTYASASVDTASPFATAARSGNKRARLLELPAVGR